jgi:hypothetical protein
MVEENPYQAPLAHAVQPGEEAVTREERRLATRLLEARERGMSLRLYLRWTAKAQFLRVILLSVFLVYLARMEIWLVFEFILGLFVGAMLRDIAVIRAQRKTWKMQVKLLDWNKVRQMAGEQES